MAAVVLGASLFVMAPGASGKSMWIPSQGLQWQYQLQGKLKTNLCVVPASGGACVRPNVYDIDLYAPNGVTLNTAAVTAIHALGAHAVCYVDAGTWEDFRPDAGPTPPRSRACPTDGPASGGSTSGPPASCCRSSPPGWPSAQAAGFDAVDFDNVDGYENDTGFPLTAAEQLTFNEDLAAIAHAYGLSVGLKNDTDQLGQLEGTFDFAINEQCAQVRRV